VLSRLVPRLVYVFQDPDAIILEDDLVVVGIRYDGIETHKPAPSVRAAPCTGPVWQRPVKRGRAGYYASAPSCSPDCRPSLKRIPM
jgi:hypothetical protein